MPSSLFSLCTDAWPAVILISQKILSTFDISNNISSLSFKSSCTCSYSHLNISSAFDEDSGAGYDPEINQMVLPTNGRYYVLVTVGGGGYGAFKLDVTKAEIPSLDAGTQEARFNSPIKPQFVFDGTAGQPVMVNITLPEDASDYTVQSVDVHVYQNGALIEVLNHSAVARPVNRLVLAANIVPPADGPVVVEIAANGKLRQPSQQVFRLEVSLGE